MGLTFKDSLGMIKSVDQVNKTIMMESYILEIMKTILGMALVNSYTNKFYIMKGIGLIMSQ